MKTDKSKLLHLLEQYSQPVDVVPADAAVIVDGMAMLQSLTSPAGTFGEVARPLFERLTKSMIAPGSRLDFVIDRYPDISIKYDEHHRRAGSGVIRVCILSGDQKLPLQWKKFLRSSDNKKAFLHFLSDEWSRQSYVSAQLTDSKVMFVNDNELCYRLQRASDGTILREKISALECNHAEADTRLILHAAHAGNSGHRCIIIKSPDTDVAVLTISHCAQINGKVLFQLVPNIAVGM